MFVHCKWYDYLDLRCDYNIVVPSMIDIDSFMNYMQDGPESFVFTEEGDKKISSLV